MAKVDLKSAYRSVSIHPSNFKYTGLKWKFSGHNDFTYMYDNRLPFGAKLSSSSFHIISQSIRRMMESRGIKVVAYLDDFLIVSNSKIECSTALATLIALLRSLGFSIAYEKTIGPCQRLTFLGIELNSVSLTMSLPEEKVVSFLSTLRAFRAQKRASCRQLQHLAGKLSWAANVIRGGRIYLQNVFDAIRTLKKPGHKIIITSEIRADIDFWLEFLPVFNWKYMNTFVSQPHVVFTDASDQGGGVVSASDWAYFNWRTDLPQCADAHINVKETLTAIMAVYRLAPTWAGKDILICTDNMTTKAVINKGRSRHQLIRQHLKNVFWLSNMYSFDVKCIHIPGTANYLADAVSRLHSRGHLSHWLSLVCGGSAISGSEAHYLFGDHMSPNALSFLSNQIRQVC